MRSIKIYIFMYIKADSGNYVARLFYILYGVRHLRPQGDTVWGRYLFATMSSGKFKMSIKIALL